MPTLTDLTPEELAVAPHQALMRLQLRLTSVVHSEVAACGAAITRRINGLANADGSLPTSAIFPLEDTVASAWGSAWRAIEQATQEARRQATLIPFGVLAVQHHRLVKPLAATTEATTPATLLKSTADDLISEAAKLRYGTKLELSDRLWAVNTSARKGIGDTLFAAIADGSSAWDTAQQLERYLGHGADCPRWTSSRLQLGKKAIAAGDPKGLVSTPCDSRGVAYNALRLARSEIQTVHNLAAAEMYRRSPWVQGVQIRLSGSHPKPDICDQHAVGGPKGDGIYEVGAQPMPPYHPNCLCYQTGVLMPEAEFIRQMRGAVRGSSDWEPAKTYASWFDVALSALPALDLLVIFGAALATWLFGSENEMKEYV